MMKVYAGAYKGLPCYCLENEFIKLVVLPQLGAKIASLFYKPQHFEVLFQPIHGVYHLPEYGGNFAQYDTSGADDMFPTIDACKYPYDGYFGTELPDHGELWSLPWVVTPQDGGLTMEVQGVALPYTFSRRITLQGSKVHIEYRVTNKGEKPLYGLWAFHGLLACDELTQIIIPQPVRMVTVHDSNRLGPVGSQHDFPVTVGLDGTAYNLDQMAPPTAQKTEKIYVEGRLTRGAGAVTLNQGQLLYQLLFPVHKVPYLGIWFNEGGFKNEYNCALEPATAYYDSLEVSKQQESVVPLAAGEKLAWYLDIELTPWGGDCNNFVDEK